MYCVSVCVCIHGRRCRRRRRLRLSFYDRLGLGSLSGRLRFIRTVSAKQQTCSRKKYANSSSDCEMCVGNRQSGNPARSLRRCVANVDEVKVDVRVVERQESLLIKIQISYVCAFSFPYTQLPRTSQHTQHSSECRQLYFVVFGHFTCATPSSSCKHSVTHTQSHTLGYEVTMASAE